MKMRCKFRDYPYEKKIKLIFGLVVLLPVTLLVLYALRSSENYIRKQQYSEWEWLTEMNANAIDSRIAQCEKSLNYLTGNFTLQGFLEIPASDYLEKNRQSLIIGSLAYNTLLSNQSFHKIRIYSDDKVARLNDLIFSDDRVKESAWYKNAIGKTNPVWQYEDGKVILTKEIVKSYPKYSLGVAMVDISDDFFNQEFSLFQNEEIEIEVIDSDGEVITKYQNGREAKNIYEIERELGIEGWRIMYKINADGFMDAYRYDLFIPAFIGILVLAITWLMIIFVTRRLLRQMDQLVAEVALVKNGDLDTEITVASQDEVGQLAAAIRDMLGKIKTLIDAVYKTEIEKRDIELDLLRSKINPHFLYNNLSAINWIAIEKGEDKIYEISTQLASFYRTALNHGKNIDKVSVEVQNVKAYIKLQEYARENSFDADITVSPGAEERYTLIFILQPLIENALEHGIDMLENGRGRIKVDIYEEGNCLVARVIDNGDSLYKKIGKNRLAKKEFGYGLRNVDQRVKIICGDDYGIILEADDTGTAATLRMDEDSIEAVLRTES